MKKEINQCLIMLHILKRKEYHPLKEILFNKKELVVQEMKNGLYKVVLVR